MTQSIMEYVYNSKSINLAFDRFIKDEDRDEFKQHIYLELLTKKGDKLIRSYQGGWIDLLVYKMMKNQYLSKSSPWAQKVKSNESNTSIDLVNIPIEDDSEISTTKLKSEVLRLLDSRIWKKHHFLKKQYHNTLFTMYFFEKKTYREISELTRIKSTTIRASVQETLQFLRDNLDIDNLID